ncbi:hypothetical protein [Sphingomonas leidyi]|uniref:hypothetical protein n=1 Tax=Sphingomonas leidyi TaxID=68569 RepID=UPI0036D29582
MTQRLTRRQAIGGAVAAGGLASWPGLIALAAEPEILFREVLLVDGTGAAPRLANVLVAGDRIVEVSAPSAAGGAMRIVAGEGRVLAPGFIDMHSHGDPLDESYEAFLAMGVTTITLGQDGSGPRLGKDLDPRSWMAAADRAAIDLNVALLSSHGTLRRAAGVPDSVRRPRCRRARADGGAARRRAEGGSVRPVLWPGICAGHLFGDARADQSRQGGGAVRRRGDEPYALGE